MKFRLKVTLSMICLMAVLFSAGGTMLISKSFEDSLEQEIQTDLNSYRMVLNTLLVINESSDWSSEKDISNILEQLSAQNSSQAGVRFYQKESTEDVTADGENTETLNDMADKESTKVSSGTAESASRDKVLYSSGKDVHCFKDFTDEVSSTNLIYQIITPSEVQTSFLYPDSKYYLQISGTFSAGLQTMYLDIAYDLSPIYTSRIHQQQSYFWIFLALVGTCAVLSSVLSFFLTRPLTLLSKTSRRIASGDYTCRSSISTKDEIGQLAQDFNFMTDRLVTHMDELNASLARQNQFVGNFTHELKTPMTSIIGYADLLRTQTLSAEEAQNAANYIFSEGKRLERLSLKLLDIFVAEHQDFPLRLASPSEIIQETVRNLQADYRKLSILFDCQLESGTCMLEPDFFISLVKNLVENAKRAMPDGGVIRLILRMTETGCQLIVCDNGKGIPEESLSHLTDAFYRVDKSRSRAQGGAGLGLALCMKIAQMHKGTIQFSSQVGKGTIVTVNLNGGLQ